MVGTTIALIGLGIAAAQTTSAIVQSRAANSAAKTQAQYGQQALQVGQNVWGQQQQAAAPYMQVGQRANQQMANFMGGYPSGGPGNNPYGVWGQPGYAGAPGGGMPGGSPLYGGAPMTGGTPQTWKPYFPQGNTSGIWGQ